MRKWFYAVDAKQQGPIQEAELVAMFASGMLQVDTLVWAEGLSNWTPARDIELFFSAAMNPPLLSSVGCTPSSMAEASTESFQYATYEYKDISGFGWYLDAWKKYGVFQGRSRRRAYWMFFLFNVLIRLVLGFVAGFLDITSETTSTNIIDSFYQLAVFIPSIAIGVRRMHDAGHTGWWILVPIVSLVFLCTDSEPGSNKYGPNPKM